MSDVLWRRLRYFLSPQFDLYQAIAADIPAGARVLEVGCGTGIGAQLLANTASSVTAMDTDTDAVASGSVCFPRPNITWLAADVCYGVRGQFDAVLMVEVLEHVPNWRSALDAVKQALVPGGVLYLSARNANADLRQNDLHEREWRAGELLANMRDYFPDVRLFNYRLARELDESTHQTPLIAVCRKGKE